MNTPRYIKSACATAASTLLLATMGSCDKTESYSELLREEEKAVNWYLASHDVELDIPADGKFLTGENAPYYRMDEDGQVYMQVINAGDSEDSPKSGDKVYFRFERQNIKYMYAGISQTPVGNQNNLDMYKSTFLFYGNTAYPSTVQFGTGIQVPLEYVGYYSEVNLVIKSVVGFSDESGQCTPYLLNVKYYPSEY